MSDEILGLIEPFVDKALKMGASEVELFAQRTHELAVNYESNHLKTATSSILEGVGIRVLVNKQLGFASVNSLASENIERGIRDALSIAKNAPPVEHYSLPEQDKITKVSGLFDPAVEELTMADVLDYANRLLTGARSFDPRISVDSGSFGALSSSHAITTSKGTALSEKRTRIEWMIFGMAVDGDDVGSFDYSFDATTSVSDADIEHTITDFGEKVVGNLGAVKSEPFEGPAVFTPDALIGLVEVLVASATATQVQAGSSYLADRLGEQVAVPELTIIDDGALNGEVGSASFDREGVSHRRVPIVEDGVFKTVLYDAFTANKEGLSSTGHATGSFRTAPSISSTNLIIDSGDYSIDEIISDIKVGVLIPRVSAFPDPVSGDFTGPIKGGQLIKDGEVTSTLKEITITGNLFEGLKNIEAISKERKALRYQESSMLAPYAKMSGMKFAV